MPSPVPDRPGLLIRDPYHYSDVTLIIPPVLVQCLECFDGKQTELDLRSLLFQITGELNVGDIEQHLIETLKSAGFLEDETYQKMREETERAFAASPVRIPAHVGSAYPEDREALRETMERYMSGEGETATQDGLMGIAAPHVSPEGGYRSYQAAYAGLTQDYKDRVFVVLGTSHYGHPERFGLTRKTFVTPWGEARTETSLVDELERRAPEAVRMEDYCHAVEHSIEFQIVFLQHLLGADIRVLPILCGAYGRSIYEGGMPEEDENVRRFLGALGDVAAREGKKLFWVLGVDMAHMGRRYGDRFQATAERAEMLDVAERDRSRIDSIVAGDAKGFWDQIQYRQDDLKWCGSAPFYTFLKAVPTVKGTLTRYEQWNIDEQSVVSFAGMHFRTR